MLDGALVLTVDAILKNNKYIGEQQKRASKEW
jgi:hypothetical protein